MKRFLAIAIVGAAVCSAEGCATDPTSSSIPWWKGIPAQVLAPTSQEAHAWHAQRHGYVYEPAGRYSGGSLERAPVPADQAPSGYGEAPLPEPGASE